MGTILTCLLIAISLSMDAFSLALAYGTCGISLKNKIILASVVGIFHFIMPLLGLFIGSVIIRYFVFSLDLIVGIIFLIIGIEMIVSGLRAEEVKIHNSWFGYLLFGLSVSIDSFTTGIGLSVISNNYVGVAFMFMVISGIFTYLGLCFGNRLSDRFGRYATIIGGILMCILSFEQIF